MIPAQTRSVDQKLKPLTLRDLIARIPERDRIHMTLDILQAGERQGGPIGKKKLDRFRKSLAKVHRHTRFSKNRGFSQAGSREIAEQTARICVQNESLAAAMIELWPQTDSRIADAASRFLSNDLSLPQPMGLDAKKRRANGIWPESELESAVSGFVKEHQDIHRDRARILLITTTGLVPIPDPSGSIPPVAQKWMDTISNLGLEHPLWDRMQDVTSALSITASAKMRMRDQVHETLQWFEDMEREFGAELEFLEIRLFDKRNEALEISAIGEDPSAFEKAQEMRDAAASELSELRRLRNGLASARNMKEQSAIITDVQLRAGRIAEYCARIEEIFPKAKISAILTTSRSGNEEWTVSEAAEEEKTQTSLDRLRQKSEKLHDQLKAQVEERDTEIERLRVELDDAVQKEEAWRNAYIREAAASLGDENAESLRAESLSDAVEKARHICARIRFCLNGSSSVKRNRFSEPTAVLNALMWLDSVYAPARAGELPITDFGLSLKRVEGCSNWKYKPSNSEYNKRTYKNAYTTTLDGKQYDLDHHIGTGVSSDEQHTLRIAFDYDPEIDAVIVGYIGRHQPTRQR